MAGFIVNDTVMGGRSDSELVMSDQARRVAVSLFVTGKAALCSDPGVVGASISCQLLPTLIFHHGPQAVQVQLGCLCEWCLSRPPFSAALSPSAEAVALPPFDSSRGTPKQTSSMLHVCMSAECVHPSLWRVLTPPQLTYFLIVHFVHYKAIRRIFKDEGILLSSCSLNICTYINAYTHAYAYAQVHMRID